MPCKARTTTGNNTSITEVDVISIRQVCNFWAEHESSFGCILQGGQCLVSTSG